MADHDECGVNGYYGYARSETLGVFSLLWGLVIARFKAQLEAQNVYDRDCPGNCNVDKNGLVSYNLHQVRIARVPGNVPPGVRQRMGWLVLVKWRLWVYCGSTVHEGIVMAEPGTIRWNDLQEMFAVHFNETNSSNIDNHLQHVGD